MGALLYEISHAIFSNQYGSESHDIKSTYFNGDERMILDHLEKTAMQKLESGFRSEHAIAKDRDSLFAARRKIVGPKILSCFIASKSPISIQ